MKKHIKNGLVLIAMFTLITGLAACGGANISSNVTETSSNANPDTIKTDGGREISANTLFLEFDPTCVTEEREQIIKDYGMSVLYFDKISGVYKVSLGRNLDAQEMLNLRNELLDMKEVTGVTYDYIGKAPGVYW